MKLNQQYEGVRGYPARRSGPVRRAVFVTRRPHRSRIAPEYNSVILKLMKTAISIPDDVFREAERAAKRLGMSRSELFSRAAVEFLKANPPDDLTASYDAAFSEPESDERLSADRRRAARTALRKVEWK